MAEDQVPRKLAWERAHPEAEFHPPCEHEPRWRVSLDADSIDVWALSLCELMDRLEKLRP